MRKIAFYAPIKPPDHHIASGDRLIAQNLMAAMTLAGYDVELASRYIAYSKREANEILQSKKAGALEDAQRLIEQYSGDAPDLWLTYHPYCKAPDWIGPCVSAALDIPYVTVEAARTGQGFENGQDRWASWRQEAQSGIKKADWHLAFKPTDRAYLKELLGSTDKTSMLPPFIDTDMELPQKPAKLPSHWRKKSPTLVATGMMRPGKKLENYRRLADALKPLAALHWNLVIIGDGPEMPAVRDLFSPFNPDRVHFTGAIPHDEVLAYMKAGDVFVWPGWKEPIGMVYLEAQLMGLPVAALDSMGVPLSVTHGETGLLADPDDPDAFSETLSTLISHPALRQDLAKRASIHIQSNHSMHRAAQVLGKTLKHVLASPSAR